MQKNPVQSGMNNRLHLPEKQVHVGKRMEDILRKNKKIKYNGTKVCKVCGRELLINEFPLKGGRICKECKNKKNRDLTAQKRIEQYLSDESMHFKRKYKKIDSSRILRKNDSGIDLIAREMNDL